jgi:hypothetical protein
MMAHGGAEYMTQACMTTRTGSMVCPLVACRKSVPRFRLMLKWLDTHATRQHDRVLWRANSVHFAIRTVITQLPPSMWSVYVSRVPIHHSDFTVLERHDTILSHAAYRYAEDPDRVQDVVDKLLRRIPYVNPNRIVIPNGRAGSPPYTTILAECDTYRTFMKDVFLPELTRMLPTVPPPLLSLVLEYY